METEAWVEQFLEDHIPPQMLSTPLSDETAGEVIDLLKREADRYWYILPSRSFELATRSSLLGRRVRMPAKSLWD